MNCPYCGYEPVNGFAVIKTTRMKGKIERGHKCSKCGRSFISEQKSIPIPFYKKELYREEVKKRVRCG